MKKFLSVLFVLTFALMGGAVANVAVGLPYACKLAEVAGFSGGFITTARDQVSVVGYPEFGASVRTASVLLAVGRLFPEIGCAMALGDKPKVRHALESMGVEIAWMDRDAKPDYIGDEGGEFEEWGGFKAARDHPALGGVEAIGDPGGIGHEPVIYFLAKDTPALMAKLREIANAISAELDSL